MQHNKRSISAHRHMPSEINRMVQEIDKVFTKSKHRLTVIAHSQEELDLIAPDFHNLVFINTRVTPGNLFEPHTTEQIYRELKGNKNSFSSQYWEQELQTELCDFQANIEVLEVLEKLYAQHIATTCSGRKIELCFVVSKPDSPLMAVFNGSKAMVYNFSC